MLLASRPILAQTISSAPQGGVFGGGSSGSRSHLDLTMTLIEARDSAPPAEFQTLVPQGGLPTGGYSSMLVASADYGRSRRRAQVAGSAVSALRYYQQLDRISAVSHSAALGATVQLPKSASLQVNQTAAYSPSYFFQLFPAVAPIDLGEAVSPAQDYRVDEERSYSYATRAAVTAGSSRGSRVSMSIERSQTDFRKEGTARPRVDVLTGRARWSNGIGRTGALSAEYEYRAGEFGYGGKTREQRVRIGAEYAPALSVSRRTVFRFSFAPSALEVPASVLNNLPSATLYRLEGEASVTYPFRPGWSAGGSYRRGVEYIAVLLEPVFSDAARIELTGLVSRRLDLSASAGFVVGQPALTRDTPSFDTYTGTTRARYAVSRSVAIYGEYLYYYYDLSRQAALAPDLPKVFEQHGVRVGVMLWTRPVGR